MLKCELCSQKQLINHDQKEREMAKNSKKSEIFMIKLDHLHYNSLQEIEKSSIFAVSSVIYRLTWNETKLIKKSRDHKCSHENILKN